MIRTDDARSANTAATEATKPLADARHAWAAILLLTAVAFGFYLVLAGVVPYHIDEIRQAGLYSRPFSVIPELTLRMQQPPLDTLLNAAAYRVLGPGDIRERILPILWGCCSLLVLGRMALNSGLRVGAAIAVGTLAVLPVFVETTPYARQYALPLLLMLLVLCGLDGWLRTRRSRYLALAGTAAVLLALSRSTDPLLFFAACVFVLVVLGLRGFQSGRGGFKIVRRPIILMSSVGGGVALPVVLVLRRYTQGVGLDADAPPLGDTLLRMITEIFPIVGASLPGWGVMLGLVAIGLTRPRTRVLLSRVWWIWPPFLGAALFVVAFYVLTAGLGLTFRPRYLYLAMPAIAILIGAAFEGLRDCRWGRWVSSAAIIVFAVVACAGLVSRATSPPGADYQAAALDVSIATDASWNIIFDHPRPTGAYRTPFAGLPRYLDRDRIVAHAPSALSDPAALGSNNRTGILLLDSHPEVEGWYRISTGGGAMSLYLPHDPEAWRGRVAAASAADQFGSVIGGDDGAFLRAVAVSLFAFEGEMGRARQVRDDLLSDGAIDAAMLRDLLDEAPVRP
jgi:4-amino-4-deoxy-L-arabinose transferase-like glycosyltransferase